MGENSFCLFMVPSENFVQKQILPESGSALDPDPHPDPHSSKMLFPVPYPDLHIINADPKHCGVGVRRLKKNLPYLSNRDSRVPVLYRYLLHTGISAAYL
jgi:hypothetical protein